MHDEGRASPADDQGVPTGLATWAERNERRAVVAMVMLYVGYFLTLCILKWRAFGYDDFDLPIFDQALWNTAQLNAPLGASIRFGSVLADHTPLILLLLTPLYWLLGWLVPGALLLLSVQTLALGGGAFPLHALARREIGRIPALAVTAAYLLHPALGYMNLFEFHPGVLAVPFVLGALAALHAERWRGFVVCCVLALSCREDVALPLVLIGAYALWRRRSSGFRGWSQLRWGVVPTALGLLWFAVAVGVVIPAFQAEGAATGASPFVQLYGYLVESPSGEHVTIGEVAGAVLGDPMGAYARASAIAGKDVPLYTLQLLSPTGGLALVAPHALLPALPTYVLNVLAGKSPPATICYQYSANVLPFVFLATVLGIGTLRRVSAIRQRTWMLAAYVLVAALATSSSWGKQLSPVDDPLGHSALFSGRIAMAQQRYGNRIDRDHLAEAKDALIALAATRAGEPGIVASFELLHRVPMRERLHSWHYVRMGRDPVTGHEVSSPDVDLALIDFRDALTFAAFGHGASSSLQREFFAAGDWRVVAQADSAVLLARDLEGPRALDLARHTRAVPPKDWSPRRLTPDVGMLFDSALVEDEGALLPDAIDGRVLRVDLDWSVTQERLRELAQQTNGFEHEAPLWLRFRVEGPEGECYHRSWPLGYTLHSLGEWTGRVSDSSAPTSVVSSSYPLLLPAGLPPGRYGVQVALAPHPDVRAPAMGAANIGFIELR